MMIQYLPSTHYKKYMTISSQNEK
uniref:Uncharacterized protein n=1 Tax=Arundo donax TaxID=35708 RepID=A0A0A9ACP2_ARUDO